MRVNIQVQGMAPDELFTVGKYNSAKRAKQLQVR
jgi:hypothetical protein